ncbi:hypothetical protein AMAG_08786 [Allomyces macrogynus ATCC 38327]|uniref:Secreted protein n=1 Tax=Allomyces macrogynus (strain ATCC 38327) TaxID=578462 RepID=A0A0L0SMT1_ALLM3|nr:hypothetical protein AMAG_08786 [Allomyces macrogynus ATCC 38327]|eukprot:KNE63690.1 hypothetical protein AMAG_08786 [Allomyces macrogynus ATCC 38327]
MFNVNQLLLVALAALIAIAAATPAPQAPAPETTPVEHPPNDPLISIFYANEPMRSTVQVLGDYATATGQCRGLEGREDGFIYMHTWPTYDNLRPAWKVRLYRDWGCVGAPAAELTVYDGVRPHIPMADPADRSKPLVVKSVSFVPF